MRLGVASKEAAAGRKAGCRTHARNADGSAFASACCRRRIIRNMSERKAEVTVTIAPHLAAYAERLVAAGTAPTISAVINDALEAQRRRDLEARRLWKEAAERADPDAVARTRSHADAQIADLPASHRYR
jgi:Arc/MetJ-type ribon-helix-helix transcriptional regulator